MFKGSNDSLACLICPILLLLRQRQRTNAACIEPFPHSTSSSHKDVPGCFKKNQAVPKFLRRNTLAVANVYQHRTDTALTVTLCFCSICFTGRVQTQKHCHTGAEVTSESVIVDYWCEISHLSLTHSHTHTPLQLFPFFCSRTYTHTLPSRRGAENMPDPECAHTHL